MSVLAMTKCKEYTLLRIISDRTDNIISYCVSVMV